MDIREVYIAHFNIGVISFSTVIDQLESYVGGAKICDTFKLRQKEQSISSIIQETEKEFIVF